MPRRPFKSEEELPASANIMFSETKTSKLLIEKALVAKSFQSLINLEAADVIQFQTCTKSQGFEIHRGSSFLAGKWPIGWERIQSHGSHWDLCFGFCCLALGALSATASVLITQISTFLFLLQ